MAKKHKHEEHENHERWLVSYADFITLLFAFFVVMYSISSVNEGKFRSVSESIHAALRPIVSAPPTEAKIKIGEHKTSLVPVAVRKVQVIREFQKAVENLNAGIQIDKIMTAQTTEHGITVTLADTMLFQSGQAALRPEALPVLQALAEGITGGLQDLKISEVRVHGYTDNIPIQTAQFPSNWELSAVRSVIVARALTELYAVPPHMVSATGFGEFKPLTDNLTPENRARNRRVEIVILTDSVQPLAPPVP